MIGAVAGKNLVAAGVHPGNLDGVFVGVGAGIGEEHLAHVVGHQFHNHLGQLGPVLIGIGLADEGVALQLGLDGVVDILVAIAQVHIHMEGGHVRVAVALIVVEVDVVAVLNGNGVQAPLLVPGLEHILLLGLLDLFRCHSKGFLSRIRFSVAGAPALAPGLRVEWRPRDTPACTGGSLRSWPPRAWAPDRARRRWPDGLRQSS